MKTRTRIGLVIGTIVVLMIIGDLIAAQGGLVGLAGLG